MKPIDSQAWSMAQTSPQIGLETVEPPHLLLISIHASSCGLAE
jgi:hypothetical protein